MLPNDDSDESDSDESDSDEETTMLAIMPNPFVGAEDDNIDEEEEEEEKRQFITSVYETPAQPVDAKVSIKKKEERVSRYGRKLVKPDRLTFL